MRGTSRTGARVTIGWAVALLGALLVPASSAPASTDFTTVKPPFTGASDYAINFPIGTCGVGPVGMINDGSQFFVSDFCNHKLYKFSAASGGDATSRPSSPTASTAAWRCRTPPTSGWEVGTWKPSTP